MSNISNTLKDNMHSAGVIKTNFYNYFFKVFYTFPDMNFIGTTAKLIPYFEELKKHILSSIFCCYGWSYYVRLIKMDTINQ